MTLGKRHGSVNSIQLSLMKSEHKCRQSVAKSTRIDCDGSSHLAGKHFLVFGDGRLTTCKPISNDDLGCNLADCVDDPALRDAHSALGVLAGAPLLYQRLDDADEAISRRTGRASPVIERTLADVEERL